MSLPFPLKLHGYPHGKTHFASEAEFPLISVQNHKSAPPPGHEGHDHHLGHTHVELWAPLYAEVPREEFAVKGRIQLFHVNGGIWGWRNGEGPRSGVFPNGLGWIHWPDESPIIGDPAGVVIRDFTLYVDPNKQYANGSGGPPFSVPINGWFPVGLTVFTDYADGDMTDVEAIVSVYMTGDPSVPETNNEYGIGGYRFTVTGKSHVQSAKSSESHGVGFVDFRDQYLPILAPLAAPVTLQALSYAYARSLNWSAPELDRGMQINDPDLHNGVPGTVVQEIPGVDSSVQGGMAIAFPTGKHKVATIWTQNTGLVGNAFFAPHEDAWTLLVVSTVDGTPTEPEPEPEPGTPVDCVLGPLEFTGMSGTQANYRRVITTQPQHGGKACSVVAQE